MVFGLVGAADSVFTSARMKQWICRDGLTFSRAAKKKIKKNQIYELTGNSFILLKQSIIQRAKVYESK